MIQSPDKWEAVRPQFDALPYPNVPLEQTPGDHPTYLSAHSCVIPYYLRYHQVIDTRGKWILDAGCGSGYKAMALALANPGARIVGIDISPKSVELAQQRVEYHGIQNPMEFHCLPLEEISSLGYNFDYINCDETLYLLPDPALGLQAMQSVLKPNGIIRVNLHSALQRANCYRVQALFKRLGCLEDAQTEEEVAIVRQTMSALNNWVATKKHLWNQNPELDRDPEKVVANFLLRGDKGYTLPQFSALLQQANLEFISMVNWRQWNLQGLFKNIEDLPIEIALGLADMTMEQQLHMFELLHPIHRLLDLYCGHPEQGLNRPLVEDWTDSQWQAATVHLHPQLQTPIFKKFLKESIPKLKMISLDQFFSIDNQSIKLDSTTASCLFPLIESPLSVNQLSDRWLKIHPVDPVSLQPISPDIAVATVCSVLTHLESAGYVLLELPE